MPYPVSVVVEPELTHRNRLTVAFRLILAIPHMILVGGPGMSVVLGTSTNGVWDVGGENGLIGAAAVILAIVSWFTIVIGGTHYAGIREFTRFYLRWQLRVVSYIALLTDRYPPFGDGDYAARIDIGEAALPRDRLTVALRLLLGIPHFIVLFFVAIGWMVVTVLAWFAILFTGEYPASFAGFSVGVIRWYFRLEAYMLLLTDQYPPFSLE